VEKLLNYLKKRLRVDDQHADRLLDLVVEGEGDYLSWLYGYDELRWTGIDECTMLERLERPFVFGFFVKAVLKSELEDEIKRKAALECWNSIDPAREEGVPAYLFRTLSFLLETEGFNQDRLLHLVDLCLRPLFYTQITTLEDEPEDVEGLFDYVTGRAETADDVKLAFLAAVLSLRYVSPNFKLKLYDRFLRDEGIHLAIREELCLNAADGGIEDYLKDRLRPYLPEGVEEMGDRYYIPVYLTSLPRRSVMWLAGVVEDRERLVERYFKERVMGYDEPYQTLGALDVCRRYRGELGLDFVVDVFRRALGSNRIEIRRTAERYLKEMETTALEEGGVSAPHGGASLRIQGRGRGSGGSSLFLIHRRRSPRALGVLRASRRICSRLCRLVFPTLFESLRCVLVQIL